MDRRKKAEADWRAKLDALGMSEYFELIERDWSSDHGRRARIKCRTCEAEFYTWSLSDLFKGRQDRLICAECGAASDGANIWERSAECDEAMAYYVAGHTVAETAEKFGVSKDRINGSVKTRGLTNGRKWGEPSNAHIESVRKEAEQRLIERLDALGCDYLGGYTNTTGSVTLKCKTCGDEFERTVSFLKHGNVICQKCEHEKTLIRQANRRMVRKEEAERKRAEKETERIKKNSYGLSYYQLERETKLDTMFACKICGKGYTPREYMLDVGLKTYSNPGYCSAECRRKKIRYIEHRSRKNRKVPENHRQRARYYGCDYDSSVTLAKLIKRDGLRCAICGETCDPNDHGWTNYMGPKSPTIDHIVPMSKGGGHVWSNVQIAHALCNSYKSNKVDEAV